MTDLLQTRRGGYTRVCNDCDVKWATAVHPISDDAPAPCPECDQRPSEGEKTYDWSICPGCGKGGISKRGAPVEGFPGQRYCSVRCAGVV